MDTIAKLDDEQVGDGIGYNTLEKYNVKYCIRFIPPSTLLIYVTHNCACPQQEKLEK